MANDRTNTGNQETENDSDTLPEKHDQLGLLLAIAIDWHNDPKSIEALDGDTDVMRELAFRCMAATVLRHEERLDTAELADKFFGAYASGAMGLTRDENPDEILEMARSRGVTLMRRVEALEAQVAQMATPSSGRSPVRR